MGESKVRSGLPNAILNFYNLSVQKKLSLVWLLCLFPACRQAEMQSYRVPKEADRPMISAEAPEMANPVLPDNPPPVGDGLPEGHPPVSAEIPAGHPEIGGGGYDPGERGPPGVGSAFTPRRPCGVECPQWLAGKTGVGVPLAPLFYPGKRCVARVLFGQVFKRRCGGFAA